MKKIIQILNAIFYMASLVSVLIGTAAYAQQFDQHYLKWKAEQEAQDEVDAAKRAARKERKQLTKEEQKAARDARYAARKERQKKGRR